MSGGDDGEYEVQLNLVPLIDILTNILFFLLVGFTTQEMQFTQGSQLRLPTAASSAQVRPAVTLSLSRDELSVEQVRIAAIVGGKLSAAMEGEKIVPLYEKLATLRSLRQERSGGVSESDDVVMLLCDREVPYAILSPVMKTAAMAGYPNFRFAVIKK